MSAFTNTVATVANLAADRPGNSVSNGDSWDLETFFNNATSYGEVAGGAFLALIGMAGLVWGGFLLVKKLMSEQSRESWLKIVALIIIGGAFVFSGITLVLNFARGGQKTVEDFGNNGKGVVLATSNFGVAGDKVTVPGAPGVTYTLPAQGTTYTLLSAA